MTNITHGSYGASIFEYSKAMFHFASCGIVTTTVYSENHGNLVIAIASEPLNGFELKLIQIII